MELSDVIITIKKDGSIYADSVPEGITLIITDERWEGVRHKKDAMPGRKSECQGARLAGESPAPSSFNKG